MNKINVGNVICYDNRPCLVTQKDNGVYTLFDLEEYRCFTTAIIRWDNVYPSVDNFFQEKMQNNDTSSTYVTLVDVEDCAYTVKVLKQNLKLIDFLHDKGFISAYKEEKDILDLTN